MNTISLIFEDFKRICDEFEKRIYYYQETHIVNLYFISEGVLVYTFVDLNEIENKEEFFGTKMFNGAMKLLFKIPVRDESTAIKSLGGISIIDVTVTEEGDARVTDMQKEGVETGEDVAGGD